VLVAALLLVGCDSPAPHTDMCVPALSYICEIQPCIFAVGYPTQADCVRSCPGRVCQADPDCVNGEWRYQCGDLIVDMSAAVDMAEPSDGGGTD
jgi:hypothetical protein